MFYIGIDIGSTYTKYCILGSEEGQNRPAEAEVFTEDSPVRQRAYFEGKLAQLREMYGDGPVVTCGYGRKNMANNRMVTELTALAKGAEAVCPGSYAILDIGGQDTKLVCQEKGKLKLFFTNERCAAGCGLFLKNVLHLLQIRFQEIDLRGGAYPEIRLSSVCAVFAQSEIVELIAEGVPEMAIVHAVLRQILVQSKSLLGKVGRADCPEVVLSGGLTRIPGIGELAEEILGRKVVIPERAAYLSAIGCAVLAREEGGA